MFETMVGVELLEGFNVKCVTSVGTVFFGKIPWKTSPLNFSSLVSDSGLPYNNC